MGLTITSALLSSGCIAGSAQQRQVFPDGGLSVRRIDLDVQLKNGDNDAPVEAFVRLFAKRADNVSIAFSGSVNLVLETRNASDEELGDPQTRLDVTYWLFPANFVDDGISGIHWWFGLDDPALDGKGYYRLDAITTIPSANHTFASRAGFYFPG